MLSILFELLGINAEINKNKQINQNKSMPLVIR